jgi:prepilin-type N-terminal cleavage/methylation domain-containing protein
MEMISADNSCRRSQSGTPSEATLWLRASGRRRNAQQGMTLIETVIALAILLVVAAGIMTVAVVGTTTTENQGNLGARTAEYAQDKMEQLISLAYSDGVSDTTQFPAGTSGGTGLTVGGSADPSTPMTTPGTGYVDYLCVDGTPVGSPGCVAADWYYVRVWQISQFAANIKQITVTAKVRYTVGSGGSGALAQSTVSMLKASSF